VVYVEEVVCVVEGVRAAGMYTASDTWAFNEYDVFFTDRRVIFAVVRCPADSREAQAFPRRSEVLDKLAKVNVRVEHLNIMYGSVKRWIEIKGREENSLREKLLKKFSTYIQTHLTYHMKT
jgi:hypothetical protein